MRIQKGLLALSALVAVQAPLSPTTGFAQQAQFERFCRDYANHAVNVARRAKEARCRSSGWYIGDVSSHYNWCKSAPEQTVAVHRQSRQKELDACLRRSP